MLALNVKAVPEYDELFCLDCKNEYDIVKADEKHEEGKKKKIQRQIPKIATEIGVKDLQLLEKPKNAK